MQNVMGNVQYQFRDSHLIRCAVETCVLVVETCVPVRFQGCNPPTVSVKPWKDDTKMF